MRLHNLVVDNREKMKEEGGHLNDEDFKREELNRASDQQFMISNSAATLGNLGEEKADERGRRLNDEKHKREHEIELRGDICLLKRQAKWRIYERKNDKSGVRSGLYNGLLL